MKRMDTTSKAFIVAGVLLFVFTLVSPGKAQSATPCPVWNPATDFRVFPDQENPNRDSCGNLDVWHFLESDPNTFPAHIPSTYTLLPGFDDDFSSFGTPILGLEEWQGSAVLPLVGINNTGSTQFIPGSGGFIVWPPGVMLVHPLPNEFAIVGWRSPFNGTVTVTGGVNDLHDTCGNGILWFIDRFDGFTNTMLASGSIPNGGSQDFQDGVGGASLASVIVNQGDFLYFLVDPNSMNHFCDSTGLTVIIRELSPAQMISNLISDVTSANFQQGKALLQNALNSLNKGNFGASCNQINAFINQVRAQSGKKLSVAEANQLIASANQVKAAIGCP